jgi:membrane fusion protein
MQPGMQLQADILLDRRALWEWVLDPLYSITGQLQNKP